MSTNERNHQIHQKNLRFRQLIIKTYNCYESHEIVEYNISYASSDDSGRLMAFCFGGGHIEALERRIRKDGRVLPGGVLKVDSFLNHQMDPALFMDMANEFYRLFRNDNVNKILTIEASGIGLACITGQVFGCPVLFAKKSKTSNMDDEFYTAEVSSFTRGCVSTILVSKKYLGSADRVLIVDDFLAHGAALSGLLSLIEQAGAKAVGAGIAIEKTFQQGSGLIRAKGYRVESLARIRSMGEDGSIEFC